LPGSLARASAKKVSNLASTGTLAASRVAIVSQRRHGTAGRMRRIT
jgi:hypothetical protein